ncbi:hypothetical protein ACTFIY_001303 [Dictyostelium cf. discoideum]
MFPVKISIQIVTFKLWYNFPASFEAIYIYYASVPSSRAIFESTIKRIDIYSPSIGFSYPSLINVNPNIEVLTLPVTFNSSFPSVLSQVLTDLQDLTISVYNDMSQTNYKNFSISNNGVFKNLQSLKIEFYGSNNPQEFYIHSFLSNVPVVNLLFINGQGVSIDPSVGIIDLTLRLVDFYSCRLQINKSSIFNNCKGICLKSPKGVHNYYYYHKNLQDFYDNNNNYEQYLPNIDNAPLLKAIYIIDTIVVGDIPESYLPSCIQCLGKKSAIFIIPNPFLNFNKTTEPYCPSFKIDQNYTNLLPTDGTRKIIITGTNLGWGGINSTPIIPNSKFAITIPKGVGTNKSINITFQIGEQTTIYYSYVLPFIKSFSIVELEGQKFLTINGTGFDFENSNNITINGQQITFNNAMGGGDNDGMIVLNGSLPNFDTESKFTVSAFVGGQSSNEVTFYYFNSINITEEKLVLNNTGGSVDINGLFVSINGINCLVTSYTNSKLTIEYPSNQVGDNNLNN